MEWNEYYQLRRTREPNWLIVEACRLQKHRRIFRKFCRNKLSALDLGCGDGAESFFLASQGYHVTAVDIEPSAIQITRQRLTSFGSSHVCMQSGICEFLSINPTKSYDLIYAGHSLHFLHSSYRPQALNTIKNALNRKGDLRAQVLLPNEWIKQDNRFVPFIHSELTPLRSGLTILKADTQEVLSSHTHLKLRFLFLLGVRSNSAKLDDRHITIP